MCVCFSPQSTFGSTEHVCLSQLLLVLFSRAERLLPPPTHPRPNQRPQFPATHTRFPIPISQRLHRSPLLLQPPPPQHAIYTKNTFQLAFATPHDITSHHITSSHAHGARQHHTTPHHTTPHHTTPHHTTPHRARRDLAREIPNKKLGALSHNPTRVTRHASRTTRHAPRGLSSAMFDDVRSMFDDVRCSMTFDVCTEQRSIIRTRKCQPKRIRTFVRSFVRSCVRAFVRLFVHSFVRACMHACVRSSYRLTFWTATWTCVDVRGHRRGRGVSIYLLYTHAFRCGRACTRACVVLLRSFV